MTGASAQASARSLAGNVLVAALVTPVVLSAGFCLAVTGVATGEVFRVLVVVDRFLPADPDVALAVLALGAIGCLGLLLVACRRRPWLVPALIVGAGVFAEVTVLGAAGWAEHGDVALPVLGAVGIALGAVLVRNAR